MTSITLDAIKGEHIKIAEMIAAFEKQNETTALRFPAAVISLKPGERYAGVIVNKDVSSYHLILLPGEADKGSWANCNEWVERKEGCLPTRREQSLLYANLKSEFEEAAYWSSETHATDSGYAWCQYFLDGYQFNYRKGAALRAVAVRRLVIE